MAAPVVLSDSYDALLSTTARNYMPKLRNNVSRSNKLVAWLEEKGRMRSVDGGERVQVPVLYGLSSSADIYSGYGALRTDPQDGVTSAFYTWAQLSASVTISRREERQNTGTSRLLSLLQTKMTQAEVSIKELLNNCIVGGRISSGASSTNGQFVSRVGSMDSGATGPLPLTALIDATPGRSRTDVGSINPSTYSWWQNQMKSSTATTYAGLKTEMTDLYTLCAKGSGGVPDLGICDRLLWVTHFNSLQSQERYLRTDQTTVNVLGGSQALAFFDAALVWDDVVPDVITNADVVDGIGTISKSTLYWINSEAMEWVYDVETNFTSTPFIRPIDQDARASQILWMGAIGTNNRRKNGVLKNVSQAIVA